MKDVIWEWIKRNACGFSFVFGVASYLIAFLGTDIDSWEHELALHVGNVLLCGGVLGLLITVAQSVGAFKKELEELLYGEEFMAAGLQLDKIWYNLSKKLCKKQFGDLQPKLFETLRNYFPKDKCYYEQYELHTNITWEDDQTRERMRVTDTVTIVLVPDDDAEFTHKIKIWTPISDNLRYNTEMREIKVEGEVRNVEGRNENDGHGRGGKRKIYELSLKGKRKYKIEYTRVSTYAFNDDNCKGVTADYIVRNMTVSLTLPDGLEAFFVDGGTLHGFEEVRQGNQRRIEKKSKGIILPHQGYIFVLTRSHGNNQQT